MHARAPFIPVLLLLGAVWLACSAGCASPGNTARSAPGDLAADWNEQVMAIAVAEDGLLTLKGVRTAAMMHAAMHDALNAIDPRYASYAYDGEAPDAHAITAAAQAAYEVAVSQYPDARGDFDAVLQRSLEPHAGAAGREAGVALGKAAATAVLEKRTDDRWDAEAEYTWHPMGPGVYAEFHEHSGTPEGFVFGAGWAAAEPFLLESQDQFRSPPPPAIGSDAYTEAFDEVKSVGAHASTTRTADQTHYAMWWKDFVENSHNRLARQLVRDEGTGLWEAARMFALLNMSVYDAYVCVFDNKFHYNHWRPYTAIRWAAHDGNPATDPDPDWNNLHRHTYAFPSYPSAHGCASAAAMTVLADTYGDDHPFTMTIAEVDSAGPFSGKMKTDPPTRSFDSFSQAAMECSMSRVYLGIHFRYDSVEGNALGTKIGQYAVDRFLAPAGVTEREG